MPASSGDPVSAALRLSLHNGQQRTDTIDKRLAVSCSRVFTTRIEYEPAPSYQSKVLKKLKNKYILLRGSNKGDKNLEEDNSEGSMKLEADAVLPTPKLTLFPAEKLELGWRGSVPVGSGLINLGNSCYLNSTLQALFHTPALANYLMGDAAKHLKTCQASNTFHDKCLICAMHKTLIMTRQSMGPCRPMFIFNNLRLICKTMSQYRQEDAHEFLRYLIESMEKAFLNTYRGHTLDSYSKETTPMNQIFGGYLRTEVQCMRCHAVSTSFQHTQDLILDVRHVSTLVDALSGFFANERLEQNDYSCSKCHQKVSAFKRFYLEKAPRVLCIQLKRFTVDGKISKRVAIPQHLNLARFLAPKGAHAGHRATYSFVSLVSHIGHSPNSGHYTATARASSGSLYTFDDSIVRSASLNAHDSNAYLIIYEKDRELDVKATPAKPIGIALPMPKPAGPVFGAKPIGQHHFGPKLVGQQHHAKANGQPFAPKLIGPQAAQNGNGQSPQKLNGQFAPKPNGQFTQHPNGQEFTPKANGQFAQNPSGQHFAPKPNGQQFTPKLNGQQFTPKPNGQQFTPKPNGQQFTPKPNGQQFTPKPNGQQFTPKPNGQQFTQNPGGQQFTLKPNGQQFTPKPNGQFAVKLNGQQFTPKPVGHTQKPNGQHFPTNPGQQSVLKSPGKAFSMPPLGDSPKKAAFYPKPNSLVPYDDEDSSDDAGAFKEPSVQKAFNGGVNNKKEAKLLEGPAENGHCGKGGAKAAESIGVSVPRPGVLKANGHSPTKANGHSPTKANGHSPTKANGSSPTKANGHFSTKANGQVKAEEQPRLNVVKEYRVNDAAGSGWSVSEDSELVEEKHRKPEDKRKREATSDEPPAKKSRPEADQATVPTKAANGLAERPLQFDYRPTGHRRDSWHQNGSNKHRKDADRRKNGFAQFAEHKQRDFNKRTTNYHGNRPSNAYSQNHYSYNKHHYHKNNRQNWR